ncbi:MAG: SDR family NAD(P)-dependent oxidoreductase [Candidatus Dadabacteria bacterium]|nr:MAG: SDR family NAD(P)-dependent oxidoreductase [Candidatus Dadabacteria bacterium]
MTAIRHKRVLITGSGRGMGLALAKRFAASGAQVILSDIHLDALSDARKLLPDAEAIAMDVTCPEAIQAARETLHSNGGPIDILVNNAGVVFGGAFADVPLERHLQTLRVNTEGLLAVTHVFLPDLIARPEAHIVNMASVSGLIGLPFGAAYAASKWAAIGFGESLRLELKELGHDHVRLTVAAPGYINTGLFDGVGAPRLMPFLDPDDLARTIVRAVRSNRPYVYTPLLVRLTPMLKGLLPVDIQDRVMAFLGATTSMKSWHGGSS